MSNTTSKDDATSFIPLGFGFCIRTCQSKGLPNLKGKNNATAAMQQNYRNVIREFSSRLHNFAEIMLSLLRYAKQVGEVAKNTQNLRRIELYNAIKDVVEKIPPKHGKPLYELVIYLVKSRESVIKKVYPIWDVGQARTISELDDVRNIAPQILCETVLQQIVNRWESHLANIVRIKYSSDTTLLTNPINLTFEQIASCDGIDSIKRLFVDNIVASAMKGGIEDHLRFFKENNGFSINFQELFPELNLLKEVMFHRDIIVHCDGVASQRHCQKMRGICKGENLPKPGEKVDTDLPYVLGAWDVVYAAGCVIAYLVSMKFVDSVKMRGLEKDIGGALVEASFNALIENRHRAVQMMIEPLLKSVSKIDGRIRLALRVNLALSYKYSGQKKKFEDIINDSEWDFVEENFRAIIATLRGNFKDAYKLIKKICKEDPGYLNNVYEWVAYSDLRADKHFDDQMAKIKASKSFTPHKGSYPVLEFGAAPEDVGKHLNMLFDSLLKEGEPT